MNAAPWLIFLAVIVYGVIHSWLASLQAKAMAHRKLGPSADRFYRLAYNLFAAASLLPVLALPALLPDRVLYTIPFPWAAVSLAVQALAGLALLVGVLQTGVWTFLGVRQLVQPPDSRPGALVVSGLYRWVRHPLYSAGLLFIWLAPRMTVNFLVLNIGLTLYIIVGAIFEERKLLREFGEAYARYRARTPMLIPGLKLAR